MSCKYSTGIAPRWAGPAKGRSVDISIGLPNTLAHPGPLMIEWSRRAEERHPGLRAALGALSGRVDAEAMRRLNYAVDGEHKDPKTVARDFLREAKLTN